MQKEGLSTDTTFNPVNFCWAIPLMRVIARNRITTACRTKKATNSKK